ncbi:MAG: GWxTD domain-containing protein, partial [Bacteroidetes bacterium]
LDSAALRYSLKAIAPLVNDHEGELLNTILREGNLDAQRLFLFHYWANRNPNNPRLAYEAFMEVARAVDRKFRSGFGYGFETDRGYVFIKYGAPDDIVTVEDDPDAPPYEIWSYNYLPRTGQTNVKFLFYNPSLAGGDFRLLHSTARGEINNPRWEVELYRNSPTEIEGTNYLDGTVMQDKMGRRARRLMKDF